jgi:hypothetical protein
MSSEHKYISDLLKIYWTDYMELTYEMRNFKPKSREDFELEYQSSLAKLVRLNPQAPLKKLEEMAEGGINVGLQNQFAEKFSGPASRLLVCVVFMSQALCEALINQILVLRFYDHGISDLFDIWDRAKLTDKWILAPKSFMPEYSFDKSGEIYETLLELISQRNNLVHYKPQIEIDVKKYGKEPKRRTFEQIMKWISSFISLPYDLTILASALMKDRSYQTLLHRDNIPVFDGHQKNLSRIHARQQSDHDMK